MYYGYAGLSKTQIKTLLKLHGPIVVGIYANYAFSYYSSGVFNGCNINSKYYINHAVLLYGWDSNDNWLIKN